MVMTSEMGTGIGLIVLGLVLIGQRQRISHFIATWYGKIGIDVPRDKYARQFVYVGIIAATLGFLMATGLTQYI